MKRTDLTLPEADDEILPRLQQLYLRLREASREYRRGKIFHYRPIGQQGDFHAASTAAVRVVLGGNRSGKTTSGVLEAIAHSLGYRPWLPEDHVDRVVRLANGDPIPVPNVGRVVAENYNVNIVQTIHPKFMEWAPDGEIVRVIRAQRGAPERYEWKNGSITHLMSYDQDPGVFEGPNGHWAWCDEPAPQHVFNGLRRGLIDFSGHIWMTMTPLAEPWINDVIVAKANDANGRIRLFNYIIWDNCVTNGGFLTVEAIESFLEDLDDDERKAREYGEFLHLAGRVFHEWQPKRPFYVPAYEIPDKWPRVVVIDPHPRKPIAVMWAAISPDNQWVVYRELYSQKFKTVAEVSNEIKRLEGWETEEEQAWPPTTAEVYRRTESSEVIALRVIDTSANELERSSGETVKEAFMNNDIYCVEAYKRNKDAGLNAVREALRVKYQWGEPGIVVFNHCTTVKQNFMNYVWERWGSSRQQGVKGEKQTPVKSHDDFIDCIRYLYQLRLTYDSLRSTQSTMQRIASQNEDRDDGQGLLSIGFKKPHAGYQRLTRNARSKNGRRIHS